MADSLARIRKLEEERSRLLEDAKEEALGRARAAIAELRELGFEYQLARAAKGGRGGRSAANGRGAVREAPCPICGFQTQPPHDARKHRGQGDRKRAFTPKQLEEMGLERVS